jgi:hypothetical protein
MTALVIHRKIEVHCVKIDTLPCFKKLPISPNSTLISQSRNIHLKAPLSTVLWLSWNQKEVKSKRLNLLFLLVRPAGFEPATYGLEVLRSGSIISDGKPRQILSLMCLPDPHFRFNSLSHRYASPE